MITLPGNNPLLAFAHFIDTKEARVTQVSPLIIIASLPFCQGGTVEAVPWTDPVPAASIWCPWCTLGPCDASYSCSSFNQAPALIPSRNSTTSSTETKLKEISKAVNLHRKPLQLCPWATEKYMLVCHLSGTQLFPFIGTTPLPSGTGCVLSDAQNEREDARTASIWSWYSEALVSVVTSERHLFLLCSDSIIMTGSMASLWFVYCLARGADSVEVFISDALLSWWQTAEV